MGRGGASRHKVDPSGMSRALATIKPPGQWTGNRSENLLNYNRFEGQGKIFPKFSPPGPGGRGYPALRGVANRIYFGGFPGFLADY